MKLVIIMMIAVLTQVSAAGFAQKISLHEKNISIKAVIEKIRIQTGYDFVFDSRLINPQSRLNLNLQHVELEDALTIVFRNQPLDFTIKDKIIVIERKENKFLDQLMSSFSAANTISGIVLDEKGNPLSGAIVSIKATKFKLVTTADGKFTLTGVTDKMVLVVSYIGYKDKEVEINSKQTQLTIQMEPDVKLMQDVVITGIINRKKESFTGTSKTVTGEELRSVGNQNVIQSLRTLDPSFLVIENNLTGSDPNTLATIELRGKTSLPGSGSGSSTELADRFATDPNAPLFILNGFEASLRQITDLDINRIASITVLKDAASTAIYGARSANGVIVVETVKPKASALSLRYTADFRIDVPDLSGYHLMNAREKLEFERLAGRYTVEDDNPAYNTLASFYNIRRRQVERGVDTYWLNEPLRTAVTQKHSIYAEGGAEEFQYGVGANIQKIPGVMKGSGRDNWEGVADLYYRKNKLNISNRLLIGGYKSTLSNYGSFSTIAGINPYYENGNYNKYLESIPIPFTGVGSSGGIIYQNVPNPLYDAQLNSESYSKSTTIQNSTNLIWDISHELRLTSAFQLTKSFGNSVDFISPLHTMFDDVPLLQKGTYADTRDESMRYTGNVMMSYYKVLKEKHAISLNARAEVQEDSGNSIRNSTVGFPVGVEGNPAFAYSYAPNSKPAVYFSPTLRRINALASMSYIYHSKYFLDASYRIDGSTAFGSAKKYSPFWSAGIGWNMYREAFLSDAKWINSLRLTANIGSTGNQNFGSFASATVYNLEQNTNVYGQGYYTRGLGNPDLEWQKTLQTSISTDLTAFDNRLSASLSVYEKYTSPLIVTVDLPSSNGIKQYPLNTGNLKIRGIEGTFSYSPIYNLSSRVIWTVGINGSILRSRYGSLGSSLASLNQANLSQTQLNSNSIRRYTDGNSPDDIWAVRSAGIDPGTGEEIFIKRDGSYTFDYDPADITVVGNTMPALQGVLNTTLRVKNLTFGAYFRYRFGGSVLNSALYSKVENISFAGLSVNQDRRALSDRWTNPGDVTEFKGISLTNTTPISSRFVQEENVVTGESISIGYDVQSRTSPWIKKAGLGSLRISLFSNEIFRLSNVVFERGTNYPFTRTGSITLNATF